MADMSEKWEVETPEEGGIYIIPEGTIYDGFRKIVATCNDEKIAAQIIREHNAFEETLEALKEIALIASSTSFKHEEKNLLAACAKTAFDVLKKAEGR